jgi:energy-coupling factor transport system permease protein
VSYRRRASPLGVVRAGVASLYCLAFVVAALTLSNPIALGALTLAIVGAGVGAGAALELRRAAKFAVPLMVTVCVINALAAREGVTVIARLGDIPLYGQTDITLEATVYGAILGLRALALILAAALYTATVDPDELLRLMRRFSFHSALSATLATRLVPLLTRDARRLADAQRCRPGEPASRVQLLRATTSGVLDRALDVAAALEVRGYSQARRLPRVRTSWSRHDLAFAASAAGIVALSVAAHVAGSEPFQAYPTLQVGTASAVFAVSALLVALAWLPSLDRRGVAR